MTALEAIKFAACFAAFMTIFIGPFLIAGVLA